MHLMVQGTLKLLMIKDAVNLEPRGGQNLGVDRDKGKLSVSIPLTSQYRLSTDMVQTVSTIDFGHKILGYSVLYNAVTTV